MKCADNLMGGLMDWWIDWYNVYNYPSHESDSRQHRGLKTKKPRDKLVY